MAFRFDGGTHFLEHVGLSGMPIEIDGGAAVYLLESDCGNVTLTDGVLFAYNSTFTSIDIVDGSLVGANVRTGAITLASALGNSIKVSHLESNGGITLTGGSSFMDVVIDGLVMPTGRLVATGTFYKFSIEGLVIGQKFQSTVISAGQGLVDFDGLDTFRLQGSILRAYRIGARLDDCDNGDIDLYIEDSGVQADNTHDAVSVEGTSTGLQLRGSVRGAANQAVNPRYGVAVGASVTNLQIDMDITGCQTGEINNAAGLEVSRKVRISTEALTDGDVLVWDGTGLIFRPDSGGGIGGGGGAGGEGVAQVTPMSFPGALTDAYTGQHRLAWPWNVELLSVRPTVGTPPSGDDTIIDVLLLTAGVGPGTSIFPTTANPQVDDGDNVGAAVVPDTVAVTAGNAITVNIDTAAGAEDLTVIVEWMRVA